MAENFVNGASRLWCRCKYESGSYRHLHTHLWNDPGPSIHLLFHVFSPYRMDRTTGTQNAVTPFKCDVNDQTESNSIFTEKLIFFIFFHRKNCCSLLSLTVFQRQMMYKFLHHCEGWGIESSPLGTTGVIHDRTEIRVSAAMSPEASYTPTHTLPYHPSLSAGRVLQAKPSRNEANPFLVTLPCHVCIGLSWSAPALFILLFSM